MEKVNNNSERPHLLLRCHPLPNPDPKPNSERFYWLPLVGSKDLEYLLELMYDEDFNNYWLKAPNHEFAIVELH